MLHINVRTNVDDFIRGFSREELRQARYAVRWALHATAEDVRSATVNGFTRRFFASSRGFKWMQDHVKVLGTSALSRTVIPAGAAGDRHRVFVGVIPPEGKGTLAGWDRYRGSLLPMMEEGGLTPGPRDIGGVVGLGRYAIPVGRLGLRPRLPQALWPIMLRLQASRYTIEANRGKRTGESLIAGRVRGLRRTYVVPLRSGESMIFQRTGKRTTRALLYAKHQTRVPARHYFFPTAVKVVHDKLAMHLSAAMRQAVHGRGQYRNLPTAFQGPALPSGWGMR